MTTNPIYVAIDTSELAAAEARARAVAPHVGGLKLGLQFFMAHGPDGVRRMQAFGLPIFLDVKLHDIGNTVAGAMTSLAPLGVAIVNVHASIGVEAMKAARAAIAPATAIIAVTVLTSFDDGDLAAIGVTAQVSDQVAHLAKMARTAGLQGIVCSGAEAAATRAAWPDAIIIVPGVRPAGGELGDQKRVMTPRAAIDAGASILVVGRPITGAADPAAAAAAIAASL
ncbi:orotidine-5'-phosphate decarboxylase [Polymorphobacter sp. PAMC 29334]|uniref:orotidine-5'-phosphate decarboxylase n=1 Tax=Polymorphobacter sp. PAMC 29334 TaxID=2862331 RepID=UPI001C78B548|nr:orotidine-5'-phosphate decarboxylase [Polymorphobacter sp. PAMC 29334]QYE35305.1 orotidine-5'-phosphate decarboxylase [Polymorphobacter sp. PAMC 29334]